MPRKGAARAGLDHNGGLVLSPPLLVVLTQAEAARASEVMLLPKPYASPPTHRRA